MTKEQITRGHVLGDHSKLWELYERVPFGNSKFQIEHFTANHIAPARSYRQVILELSEKSKAFNDAYANKQKAEARLRMREKLRRWLGYLQWLPFVPEWRSLIEASMKQDAFDLKLQEKYESDAEIEVETLCAILSKLPEFTREQFEEQEKDYWTTRLLTEARHIMLGAGSGMSGHLESLHRIGYLPEAVIARLHSDVEANRLLLQEEAKKQLAETKS